MRVRLLTTDLSQVAGSSFYSEELALRLAARGHDVSVVCFAATPIVRERCRVVEIGRSPKRERPLIWRFAHHLDEAHCRSSLSRSPLPAADVAIGLEHLFLRSHKRLYPDCPLVYVPLSLIAPVEIESYGLSAIARATSVHKFDRLQRWALRQSDATMRFTQMSCDCLDAYYGARLARRYVINPMPVAVPNQNMSRTVQSPLRLLSVGRLTESKNVETVVRLLSSIRSRDWVFDVVGPGERLDPLKRLVGSLGLTQNVRCHGRQPDTTSWYQRSDLLLFASKLDNCPLVVLEAMSHGLTVLGIRPDGHEYQSGIEELVEHQRTGLLANGETDFRDQLEALVSNPASLNALGRSARDQIERHHTWDAHLDRYEDLFAELRSDPLRHREPVASANSV